MTVRSKKQITAVVILLLVTASDIWAKTDSRQISGRPHDRRPER